MIKRISFVAAMALAAACGTSRSGGGSANVVATSSALSSAVGHVTVTISAPGKTTITQELVQVGTSWQGTIGDIPVGNDWTFHADAFDATTGAPLYSGSVTPVTITAGTTVQVALILQDLNAPPVYTNAAPIIDGIAVSTNQPTPGQIVAITVSAHDPNAGDTLTYTWTASGGSFDDASAATTNWTAPASDGVQTLQIVVADQKGATATMSFPLDVESSFATGSAAIGIAFNNWPVVSNVSATPTRINVTESTVLSITATDPDGDVLAYSWNATGDCLGNFDNPTSVTPVFTLATLPSSGTCTLAVTADDGHGGHTNGSITITTGAPIPPELAPQVDSTFQSTTTANGGDSVQFSVNAHDPQGGTLTYAWSTSRGALSSTNSSAVTWTSPCAFGTAAITVRVTITNAIGGTVARTFTINPDNPFSTTCDSCRSMAASGGYAGSSVYTIDPDGPGGADPFSVYCNGYGTLIMKANGDSTFGFNSPYWTNADTYNGGDLSLTNGTNAKYSSFATVKGTQLCGYLDGIGFCIQWTSAGFGPLTGQTVFSSPSLWGLNYGGSRATAPPRLLESDARALGARAE